MLFLWTADKQLIPVFVFQFVHLFRSLQSNTCAACIFTARCTLVQSAVLRPHICLSVRASVTLVDCDHIGWNSSKIILPLLSAGRSLSADPNIMDLLQGEQRKFGPKVTQPLSIANCGRMITDSALVTRRAYRKPQSLFHYQPHHQQNHNVHVHGKVTVTAVSVQNKCALSLRNARIWRKWLGWLRHPVHDQQSAQWENSFYKGLLGRSSQQVLSKWLDHAVAGRPLRPEIQQTDTVVMLQHCSLLHPCQKITNV